MNGIEKLRRIFAVVGGMNRLRETALSVSWHRRVAMVRHGIYDVYADIVGRICEVGLSVICISPKRCIR